MKNPLRTFFLRVNNFESYKIGLQDSKFINLLSIYLSYTFVHITNSTFSLMGVSMTKGLWLLWFPSVFKLDFHSEENNDFIFCVEIPAQQSKNTVCAVQINYKLLPFPLEKSFRNEQMINSLSWLKTVSTISIMCKYSSLAWK